MTRIAGNTFAIRQRLLAVGGKWNRTDCCWMIPDEVAQEALALVMAQGERPPYPLAQTPKRYGIVDPGANQTISRSKGKPGAMADATKKREYEPAPDGMVRVDERLFEAGKSRRGGWSRKQVSLLGVPWPLKDGWKQRALGGLVTRERAREFVKLRDGHLKY